MARYYYCFDCRKIGKSKNECGECKGRSLKELKEGAPINIIGTKQKGRIFKMKEESISILLKNEFNEESIREVSYTEVQKII